MGWGNAWARIGVAACFLGTALLAAGTDLSALTGPAAAPVTAEAGDRVTLNVHGWLDNGTTFLDERALQAQLGASTLPPGLEALVEGLARGAAFNATLSPEEGYGASDPTRITQVARNENISRAFTVPYDSFTAQVGPPYVGETVRTRPWDAVVVSADDPVVLRYLAKAGDQVQLYRYWPSRVTGVDNQTIDFTNLIRLGDRYTLSARPGQAARTARVTKESATNFTLDSNPPLAGQRLHVQGRVLGIQPGSGARHASGTAFALGPGDCASCHGGAGFIAVNADATATVVGGSTVVNVTVSDPWLHDLRAVTLAARLANTTTAARPVAAPVQDLASDASKEVHLTIPTALAKGTVEVTLNATAHHAHRSGGKPDDLPYQIVVKVPVGGARSVSAATVSKNVALVRAFDTTGRVTGFAALGVLAFPAVQGYRRHLRKKPLLRVPSWLDSHLAVSLAAIALTLVHGAFIMSGKWHGNWTPGVLLGAAALVLMGVMGLTGLPLAGWTSKRWPSLRRVHFVAMLALVVASVIHALFTA